MEESKPSSGCFGREGQVLPEKWNIKKLAEYLQRMWKAAVRDRSPLGRAVTAGGSAEQTSVLARKAGFDFPLVWVILQGEKLREW